MSDVGFTRNTAGVQHINPTETGLSKGLAGAEHHAAVKEPMDHTDGNQQNPPTPPHNRRRGDERRTKQRRTKNQAVLLNTRSSQDRRDVATRRRSDQPGGKNGASCYGVNLTL